MDENAVKRLALILSVQAEIEGMKVANEESTRNNRPFIYSESEFNKMASRLSDLAYAHNQQLF